MSICVEEGERRDECKRKEELPHFASRKVVCDGHDLENIMKTFVHHFLKKIDSLFIGCRFQLYFLNHSFVLNSSSQIKVQISLKSS